MIEGINIRCNIGPFEILRSPAISLVYRRAAVVSRAEITVSDPGAEIGGALQTGMSVKLRFGYRGEANLWHEWQGTVSGLEQSGPDALSVAAVGREQAPQINLEGNISASGQGGGIGRSEDKSHRNHEGSYTLNGPCTINGVLTVTGGITGRVNGCAGCGN